MRPNSSSRISNSLNCLRLLSLITAVCIVIGSLGFYSNHSLPLTVTSDTEDDQQQSTISITTTWIIQTISDRRLISTLVAAQASIFCPLFMLLSQSPKITTATTRKVANDKETEDEQEDEYITQTNSNSSNFLEMACQFLMPLGLALSWIFSILFDMKSAAIMHYAQSNNTMSVCLLQEENNDCAVFDIIYGLKYIIVGLFAIETILVTCTFCISDRIQLPLEEDDEVVIVVSDHNLAIAMTNEK